MEPLLPQGELMNDSERLSTLAVLKEKRKEAYNVIYRLPLGNRYQMVEDREKELYD